MTGEENSFYFTAQKCLIIFNETMVTGKLVNPLLFTSCTDLLYIGHRLQPHPKLHCLLLSVHKTSLPAIQTLIIMNILCLPRHLQDLSLLSVNCNIYRCGSSLGNPMEGRSSQADGILYDACRWRYYVRKWLVIL